MSHIFISYSRRNNQVVGQFVEHLQQQDFIVWQDVNNISAGEAWQRAIFDAIEGASAVLVFWSQTASTSTSVRDEIDHALENDKLIIPLWMDTDVPLRNGLAEANAVIASGFSVNVAQKLAKALLDKATRIQRQVIDLDTRLPMDKQSIETRRQMIGDQEYVAVSLVTSVYSHAEIIASPSTIISQVSRIQLMVQVSGPRGYNLVDGAFKAIHTADASYPDEKEPLVGLYVTGPSKADNSDEHSIDAQNIAHYSDIVRTTNRAISYLTKDAAQTIRFQLFQRSMMEISFLMGVQFDRWIPLQLYKWIGDSYIPIANIPPRIPS